MSSKLRLGPFPKTELIRMNIALPAPVKADLDRYAELYGAAYGEQIGVAALVPHMLATFMERDRAFRRSVQSADSGRKGTSAASSAATSSTKDTDGEGSSSR